VLLQGAIMAEKTRVKKRLEPGPKRKPEEPTIENEILRGLHNDARNALLSKAEFVNLNQHDILHEAGAPIKFGYFVNSGIVSILSILSDGKSVEVGLVGREGFVGVPLAVGFHSSANRAVVQVPATAFKVTAATVKDAIRDWPELERELHRHSLFMGMQSSQTAACNRLHEIDARLARWLLMCHDRLGQDSVPLTQEFLAQMLGIRRASVTVAAGILQKAGLIDANRGQVTILDRKGLEDLACECYSAIQEQKERWQKDVQ
jgi:CRP-like cAMP-binding protein